MEHVITITPGSIGARGQKWTATLPTGELISSRTPLCAAARALLAAGAGPSDDIAMRHGDGPIAMRSSISWAARRTVSENEHHGPVFAKWSPYQPGDAA